MFIPKNSIRGDINYTFVLIGSKDNRKSNYTVMIEMKSTLTPNLGLRSETGIPNRDKPNVYDSKVYSRMPDSIKYKWTLSWANKKSNITEYLSPEYALSGLNRKIIKIA